MRIASLADVKARLSAFVDQAEAEGPVIITRNGSAAAVLIVPQDDADLERLVLARSPRFQAMLNKSRKSMRAGKGLSSNEFWDAVQERANARTATKASTKRTRGKLDHPGRE